jgi:hypothetical protein
MSVHGRDYIKALSPRIKDEKLYSAKDPIVI